MGRIKTKNLGHNIKVNYFILTYHGRNQKNVDLMFLKVFSSSDGHFEWFGTRKKLIFDLYHVHSQETSKRAEFKREVFFNTQNKLKVIYIFQKKFKQIKYFLSLKIADIQNKD